MPGRGKHSITSSETRHLLCARCCCKCFTFTTLSNSHLGSRTWALLLIPILYVRKLRHGEMSSLPQNTWPEGGGARIQARQ